MGLFGNKETCALCGGKLGIASLVGRYDTKSGQICMSCGNKAGYIYGETITTSKTLDDVKIDIEEHDKIMERKWKMKETFDPNLSIQGGLLVDEKNKMFGIEYNKGWSSLYYVTIHNYKDLIAFDYLEDGISVTSGGLGSSIAGGLLFGSTGAIVGGITANKKNKVKINKMQMVLTMNSMEEPTIIVDFLNSEKVKGSFYYETYLSWAQQWIATLTLILRDSNSEMQKQSNVLDPTDQLRKFKGLLDDGIITQEEFDAKKKQLLDL